jgi:phage tail-like protein
VARKRASDYFQNDKFHLIDMSFAFPLVFIPIFGFSGCSSPEITNNLQDVKEGVYEFPRKVNKGNSSISTLTLRQGVQFVNSDLWDWMRKSITGNIGRRDLLLVQFSGLKATGNLRIGSYVDIAVRVPGRAWYMTNCIPSRLKTAGDFDAMDHEVSIAELDLECEGIFQFDTGV